jgi:hypothetical protein
MGKRALPYVKDEPRQLAALAGALFDVFALKMNLPLLGPFEI